MVVDGSIDRGMVLTVAPRRKARYDKRMADENDPLSERAVAPRPRGRSFVPVRKTDLLKPNSVAEAKEVAKGTRPRGIPSANVNPLMVQEFADEVNTKISSGQSRMRWFANHLMLFVVGILTTVSLQLTIFADIDAAYFQLPLVGWVGLLALHASYAMGLMLRRSDKECQLKAVIPESFSDDENDG